MQFLRSIWKILHLTEYFYTGTARGARDKYEVWVPVDTSVPVYQVYQEDQEQMSGDTYISNVVFRFVIHQCTSIQYILHSSQVMLWGRNQAERLPC